MALLAGPPPLISGEFLREEHGLSDRIKAAIWLEGKKKIAAYVDRVNNWKIDWLRRLEDNKSVRSHFGCLSFLLSYFPSSATSVAKAGLDLLGAMLNPTSQLSKRIANLRQSPNCVAGGKRMARASPSNPKFDPCFSFARKVPVHRLIHRLIGSWLPHSSSLTDSFPKLDATVY